MLGFQPVDRIHELFRDSWAVAVPSLWEEPFGHVAIEATMNGVPVVATNAGGLREIIHDGETGFLCTPGDPASLAAGLLNLLTDRELTERLGTSAHQLAMEKFTEDRLIDQFLGLYASIRQTRTT